MAQRIGGSRRKSRHKLTKNVRAKGKISLRQFFQELNAGDKVVLKLNSSYNHGTYHMRHHGKMGTILGKVSGKKTHCYRVEINDIGKTKTLILHPLHLKKL